MDRPARTNIILFLLKRKWILILLCAVTPLGFLFKFYSGLGHKWFNDYGAGLLYEIFWCLVAFFFVPHRKYIMRIVISVFIVTCILEILQLWHPAFLERIHATFLGGALLGSTFVWWDFPHYVLGCIAGWLCMRAISRHSFP